MNQRVYPGRLNGIVFVVFQLLSRLHAVSGVFCIVQTASQEGKIRMGRLASWSIFLNRFGLNRDADMSIYSVF